MKNDNVEILARIRGVAARPSTPEDDADPRNPNAPATDRIATARIIAERTYDAAFQNPAFKKDKERRELIIELMAGQIVEQFDALSTGKGTEA